MSRSQLALSWFFLFSLTPLVGGCKFEDKISKPNRPTKEYLGSLYKNDWKPVDDSLVFMTFNVENLFDVQDDPGKDDSTFLPAQLKASPTHIKKCKKIKNKLWRDQCLHWDWNQKAYNHKLKTLSQSILQAKAGKGPDILVLQEVENRAALQALNEMGLGYKTVILIEGKDRRGIDIALLSRLPLVGKAKLHNISFEGFEKKRIGDTRGILQVDLRLPNLEVLTVLGVHFPAPFHPAAMRQQAFEKLNEIRRGLPSGRMAVAAGDFNVPKREDEKLNMVLGATEEDWVVGHKVACKTCPGSTYYPPKDSWSFLDMILWSKEAKSSWGIQAESMRILNQAPGQMAKSGAPARFNAKTLSGVSDHWPLAVDLVLKR